MKVDEAVSLAARAAMRACEDGVSPDDWAHVADCAIEASIDAVVAMRAAEDAAVRDVGPDEVRALRDRAFVATLQFATAALLALAHLKGLEAIDWPEELTPEVLK